MINMIKTVLRVYAMSGNLKSRFIVSFIFSFFESYAANVPIIMMLFMLFNLINGTLTAQTSWILFGGLVAGILLRMVFKYFVVSRQQGSGYVIFAKERMKIGDRLKRYPMGYYSDDSIGTISSVLTSDLIFIEDNGVGAMGNFTAAFVGIIVSMIMITIFDWRIGIVFIFFLILCSFCIFFLERNSVISAKKIQGIQKDLVGSVIEYIQGIPVIKAFNLVDGKHKKTAKDFERFHKIQIEYEILIIKAVTIVWLFMSLGTSAIIFASSYFGQQNTMAIPFVVLLIIFAFQIYNPVQLIALTVATINMTDDGLNRYEAIQKLPVIDEDGKDIPLKRFDISFEDVHFSYDSRKVLRGINFTAKENTMTALVGRSGSGKSTIVNLIARFWDTDSGKVTIDGINIKELSIDSLYKNISMVFQHVYLFNDTIYNNIIFGKPDATREEVVKACKKARCHDFIMKLDKGYDTMVGEGGCTLSGGEKQRISIARAILKDAPIVLLDEATASIDPENEAFIQEAINELIKRKTLIVIAHKLSSIKSADKIIVVDDGNIIEEGTHDELISRKGEYYSLWDIRMKSRSWEIER